MNHKDVRVGQLVTWSMGDVRARVAVLLPASKEAGVELAVAYASPEGRVFPKGYPITVPCEALRAVS